jgi:hypothetical protein
MGEGGIAGYDKTIMYSSGGPISTNPNNYDHDADIFRFKYFMKNTF